MSHRLRRLREQFDDPLFVAAGRTLVPTARTEALRPVIGAALCQLRDAVNTPPSFDPATSNRRFVVIGSDFGEFVTVPRMLASMKVLAPSISLHFRPPSPTAAALLASGDVDIAIGPPFGGGAGLIQRPLKPDPFVAVVRRDHPTIRRKPTKKQYLAGDHLLVAPRGVPFSALDEHLKVRDLKRHVALTVAHFSVAPFIVAESDLLWSAQETLAHAAARYVDLSIYPHPFQLPDFRGFVTWHERSQRDPGHRWLREWIFSRDAARPGVATPRD